MVPLENLLFPEDQPDAILIPQNLHFLFRIKPMFLWLIPQNKVKMRNISIGTTAELLYCRQRTKAGDIIVYEGTVVKMVNLSA